MSCPAPNGYAIRNQPILSLEGRAFAAFLLLHKLLEQLMGKDLMLNFGADFRSLPAIAGRDREHLPVDRIGT